jgi:hypothetical protein
MAGFDPIYGPAYGAEGRDDWKLLQLNIELHYSTENIRKVNLHIKSAKGFLGDSVFGKFTDRRKFTSSVRGVVSFPFGNPMKALFRFILVHCDHVTVYEEFKDANEKVQGIEPLARIL